MHRLLLIALAALPLRAAIFVADRNQARKVPMNRP
jgi:hypothetical protein